MLSYFLSFVVPQCCTDMLQMTITAVEVARAVPNEKRKAKKKYLFLVDNMEKGRSYGPYSKSQGLTRVENTRL